MHTIKGLREQFRAVGKFHTPPELALLLRSYIPGEPAEVYEVFWMSSDMRSASDG